jgi:hypothetical protein
VGDGLEYVILDKGNAFQRKVANVDGSAELLCNAISTAEFIVPDDHPALPAAAADGARCIVRFRGAERFRGAIVATPGTGPVGETTVRVESDIRKLWHWQGWPVPTSGIGAQTDKARVYSGSVEGVFKSAIGHAFTRLGVPWLVGRPELTRGFSTRVDFRFDYLGEKLVPLLDLVPLVVTLAYDDDTGTTTVDLRQPLTVAGELTVASGVLDEYDFNRQAPTVTRLVIGGAGEGAAREFAQVIDAAREDAWGDIIEGFVDAGAADVGADLAADAVEPMADGAPISSLASTLIETDRLVYGDHYTEGDLVQVRVGPVQALQQIRGVSVVDSRDEGVLVTPRFGDVDDDDVDAAMARAIGQLARGVRTARRR